MNSGFSEYCNLDSDGDFIEDFEETSTIPKKDWFKPASASLARLDKVKPVATVYNLGLRDPRDLQAGRGKTASVPVASPLSELKTEPPLSTVSYQKAAWGSQNSIPELLKQMANAGTRPSRPSSAKTGSINKLPQSRKVRPQSAKDPLCPPGKKKNGSTFGVKGQKCDPSERAAKLAAPSVGSCIGWAGPPAGLCDPSTDMALNFISSANSEQQKSQMPPPPPPQSSPEPENKNNSANDDDQYSPTPSPVCLSLSLPSADVDASDDLDTGRLLEEVDRFVKTRKKKESQKMKYFRADERSPRKTDKAPTPRHSTQQKPLHDTNTSASQDQERGKSGGNGSQASVTPQLNSADKIVDSFDPQTNSLLQEILTGNNTSSDREVSVSRHRSELSLDLESVSEYGEAEAETEKPFPPSNGFDLEYLGPAHKGKKNRSHPIFLMPDNRPALHKEPRPPSSGPKPPNDLQQNASNEGPLKAAMKETKREPAMKTSPQQKNLMHGTRSGVQIREDCNITVDITPRNMGRKVSGGKSRKAKPANDLADFEIKNELSSRPTGEEKPNSTELNPKPQIASLRTKDKTVNLTSNTTTTAAAAATTVSVIYDDEDNTSDCKKTRRRRGPMKEKDLVTMVSNLSLSDEDWTSDVDDASEEVDIPLQGPACDQSGVEMGRSPSVLSRGERNYYDIARKHTKDNPPGLEEKENFITMTTKTILFGPDKPTESVVKTILDPLLAKPKEHPGRASPEKLFTKPKSANRPKSGKLSKSDLHNTTPPTHDPLPAEAKDDAKDHGEFTTSVRHQSPPEEDRPESRMGFVPMENDREDDTKKEPGAISQRPPSGKRRPLSGASKTLTRPQSSTIRHHHQNVKETVQKAKRPQSASSVVSSSPSIADIHRANAAAQALRAQREAAAITKPPSSGSAGSHEAGSQRHYASYSRSAGRGKGQTMPSPCKPVFIFSKDGGLEVDDTESMEECKEIQNRLARYGIDVKAQTLERALFPPSGKTLYYELDAQLPKSYSSGLLSHPRYWLPEEHKKLRLAEKKLAMAELSLWKQKKEEERKARLAAGKGKTTKKGKKKGKKKLIRRQSVC